MALDRQDIEKKDFPIGRRGYEPEAVDAHLRTVATEFEELRQRASSGDGAAGASAGGSLAAAASEQIRGIVEAAERTAADIQEQADRDARRVRQEAERDADRTRSEAGDEARQHVERISQAAAQMLERLDAMESELGGVFENLRTGANRLTADLSLLQGSVGELRGGEAERTAAPAAAAPAAAPQAEEPEPEPEAQEPAEEAAPAAEAEAEAPAAGGDDAEGARLIALNMALNGSPREETDRYLAENFSLPDRDGLLDEVYASIGQ